jgi:hypothetical protein
MTSMSECFLPSVHALTHLCVDHDCDRMPLRSHPPGMQLGTKGRQCPVGARSQSLLPLTSTRWHEVKSIQPSRCVSHIASSKSGALMWALVLNKPKRKYILSPPPIALILQSGIHEINLQAQYRCQMHLALAFALLVSRTQASPRLSPTACCPGRDVDSQHR